MPGCGQKSRLHASSEFVDHIVNDELRHPEPPQAALFHHERPKKAAAQHGTYKAQEVPRDLAERTQLHSALSQMAAELRVQRGQTPRDASENGVRSSAAWDDAAFAHVQNPKTPRSQQQLPPQAPLAHCPNPGDSPQSAYESLEHEREAWRSESDKLWNEIRDLKSQVTQWRGEAEHWKDHAGQATTRGPSPRTEPTTVEDCRRGGGGAKVHQTGTSHAAASKDCGRDKCQDPPPSEGRSFDPEEVARVQDVLFACVGIIRSMQVEFDQEDAVDGHGSFHNDYRCEEVDESLRKIMDTINTLKGDIVMDPSIAAY